MIVSDHESGMLSQLCYWHLSGFWNGKHKPTGTMMVYTLILGPQWPLTVSTFMLGQSDPDTPPLIYMGIDYFSMSWMSCAYLTCEYFCILHNS